MGDAIVGARTRALDQFNSAAINRATAPIGVKINQTGAEGVARASRQFRRPTMMLWADQGCQAMGSSHRTSASCSS